MLPSPVPTVPADLRGVAFDVSQLRNTVDDDFRDGVSPDRWIDHYLPHWTTPDRSRSRHDTDADGLRFRIDADQQAWLIEDGFRVSSLQTGQYSGPVGSTEGQHPHREGLRVRSEYPPRHLWTPTAGAVEVVASASADTTLMLAAWLVGVRDGHPDDAGEILLFELYGSAIGSGESLVRLGVKAHQDPRMRDDVIDVAAPIDATAAHSYAAEWDAEHVRLYIDGRLVRELAQGLAYPLQLMIDLFEFPESNQRRSDSYPKTARVHRVRGWEA